MEFLIHLQPISARLPTFRVMLASKGEKQYLGTVQKIYVRHIGVHAWEATTDRGEHMAVHEHEWQAAVALKSAMNGQFNPAFPIALSHKSKVVVNE
jgi:hypothetical protein